MLPGYQVTGTFAKNRDSFLQNKTMNSEYCTLKLQEKNAICFLKIIYDKFSFTLHDHDMLKLKPAVQRFSIKHTKHRSLISGTVAISDRLVNPKIAIITVSSCTVFFSYLQFVTEQLNSQIKKGLFNILGVIS